MVRIHVPEPSALELIDMGDDALSEEERHDLLFDLMIALLDKHEALSKLALCEMMNQLIMEHGLRDAAEFV